MKYKKRICLLIILMVFLLGVQKSIAEELSETPLDTPKIISIVSSAHNKLVITWEPVEGAEYYELYYMGGNITSWQLVQDHITAARFVHLSSAAHPVLTGIKYTYSVVAVRGADRTPVGENVKTGTAYLKKVTTTKVGANAYNKINIKWNQVAGAEGYRLYRLENGKWAGIANMSASRSCWTHVSSDAHPVKPGVVYTYRVKAYRTSLGKKYFSGSAGSASGKTIKHRMWSTSGSYTYYYLKGKKVTGWNTIDGCDYYFSPSSGRLVKNAVAGEGSTLYYVGEDGKKVDDKTMNAAVAYIRNHTTASQTNLQKLEACYKALMNQGSYERFYDKVSMSKIPDYAYYQLTTSKGNCYRAAAGLAYIAKALGFDTRVASGAVSSRPTGNLSTHGWTEIRSGGDWTMSDISMGRSWKQYNLFMMKSKLYPFRLARYEYYHLSAVNGRIILTLQKP